MKAVISFLGFFGVLLLVSAKGFAQTTTTQHDSIVMLQRQIVSLKNDSAILMKKNIELKKENSSFMVTTLSSREEMAEYLSRHGFIVIEKKSAFHDYANVIDACYGEFYDAFSDN